MTRVRMRKQKEKQSADEKGGEKTRDGRLPNRNIR